MYPHGYTQWCTSACNGTHLPQLPPMGTIPGCLKPDTALPRRPERGSPPCPLRILTRAGQPRAARNRSGSIVLYTNQRVSAFDEIARGIKTRARGGRSFFYTSTNADLLIGRHRFEKGGNRLPAGGRGAPDARMVHICCSCGECVQRDLKPFLFSLSITPSEVSYWLKERKQLKISHFFRLCTGACRLVS